MSARTDKKRENIVALTHTEIMLVLAVIILLLLLAKGIDLAKTQEQLKKSEEARIALLGRIDKAPDEIARMPEMADIGEQVAEILIPGGVVNDDDRNRRLGEIPVAASVSVWIEEKIRNDAANEIIDKTLAEAESNGEHSPEETAQNPEQKRAEKIIRLKESADKSAADADALRRENEKLIATINAIKPEGQIPDINSHQKSLRDKIGFLPCWVGNGKRLYYHTYNITYYSGADVFQITPHRDWRIGADIVDRALAGGIPSLKKYPQGRISRETLLAFGERLDREKQNLYGSECRLTATINDDADGKIVNFILNKTGLYPIWRK